MKYVQISSTSSAFLLIAVWRLFPGTFGIDIEGPVTVDIVSEKCVANPLAQPLPSQDDLHAYLNILKNLSVDSSLICDSLPQGTATRFFTHLPISVIDFEVPKQKADLITFLIPKIKQSAEAEIQKGLKSVSEGPYVYGLRYVTSTNDPKWHAVTEINPVTGKEFLKYTKEEIALVRLPWYFNALAIFNEDYRIDPNKFDTEHNANSSRLHENAVGYWTWPYFMCTQGGDGGHGATPKWLISYTSAFRDKQTPKFGMLSFDVDLTQFPINQCDLKNESDKNRPMGSFHGTHKCDSQTTSCHFLNENVTERGWLRGKYECLCKASHHAADPAWKNRIPGSFLESIWCLEKFGGLDTGEHALQNFSSCRPCQLGCPDCTEEKSCMAEVNYIVRMTMLCISILCSVGTLGLIIGVYNCRKHQIFSASSPIFLCICLFGCSIMYTEIVVLFPVLSREACVAVKWTRHLGFCITYTALYMKLCRVYLTFRVKSAHKIKLTEKHLLHWMSPIMVIMLLYLLAWTISATPDLEIMRTHDQKRLYQCVYNWWDHVLSVGEIIFLAYGVFICWRIRENHDAQFISYSIYNIALVNVFMVTLHLMIMPKAGPDMKYLLAFVRVQMSTTITIALVLGSKIYRAYRGDYPTMKEIANSANGFGGEILDLGEENEQLKEELQKMAYQMEKIKSYAMTKNNRHISHPSAPLTDKMENLTSL